MCTSNHDKDKDVALSTISDPSESLVSKWTEIDWKVVNATVTRLRRRIYRASKQRNWKKLRSLQRLMVKSEANLLRSIRHVTQNSGKNTPGIDSESEGEIINTPQNRILVYKELRSFNRN
jgi:RNA-directed DNA polymerase